MDIAATRSVVAFRRILNPRGSYRLIARTLGGFYGAVFLGAIVGGSRRMGVFNWVPSRPADLELLGRLLEDGKLTPAIDRTYPLDQAPDAVRYLAEGRAHGKVVLLPGRGVNDVKSAEPDQTRTAASRLPPAARRMRSVSKSTSSASRSARVALPANWCWYPLQALSAIDRPTPLCSSRTSSVAARSMRSAERRAAPVLRRGEERGRHRERAKEREERPELLVDDHRVPGGAGGRGEDHGLGDEQVVVEDVGERLEQPADAGLVDRECSR